MTHNISIAYYSGTKSRIDLKPGCEFKFVCRQKFYVKKLPVWPFFTKGPLKSALQGPFRGPFGVSMKEQEGPLSPGNVPQEPKNLP